MQKLVKESKSKITNAKGYAKKRDEKPLRIITDF